MNRRDLQIDFFLKKVPLFRKTILSTKFAYFVSGPRDRILWRHRSFQEGRTIWTAEGMMNVIDCFHFLVFNLSVWCIRSVLPFYIFQCQYTPFMNLCTVKAHFFLLTTKKFGKRVQIGCICAVLFHYFAPNIVTNLSNQFFPWYSHIKKMMIVSKSFF